MSNDLTDGEKDGFIAIAPSFVTIGADGYKISQLKVEGVEDADRTSYVQIQMLNSDGVAEDYYDWWQGGKSPHNKGNGWYSNTTILDGRDDDHEVIFSKGQGLWITAVAGARIVSSGEVNTNNVTIALEDGFQMLANPYPCSLNISSIKITGVEDADRTSYVQIQMLNSDGVAEDYYDWWQGGKSPHNKGNGWYSNTTILDGRDEDHDVTFFPGQALWITAVDGAILTFESPLTDLGK